MRTAWDVRNDSTTLEISHEYPTLPDIVTAEKNIHLPTCVTPHTTTSLQQADTGAADLMHQASAKVM